MTGAVTRLATLAAGAGLALAGVYGWQALHPAAAPAETEAAAPAAPLTPAQQQHLGIATTLLAPATAPLQTMGFARAIDTAPLAMIDSEIATARAAAAASAADAARLRALAAADQSASARSVQAAEAQAATDGLRIRLAEQRIGLEFGPGLARLDTAARGRLIADIAAGRTALLRIDVPGAATASGVRVGDPGVAVTILGPAAAADVRVQGAALLAILRGALVREAAAGRMLPATIGIGGVAAGTIVPRSAVLRWQGRLWVFVAKGSNFDRRSLDGARAIADGWFTATGVKPGDRVVTAGAESLLAAEQAPPPAASAGEVD